MINFNFNFKRFDLKLGRDRTAGIVLHYPWWCKYFLRFFKLKIYSGFMGETEFDLDLNYKLDGTFRAPLHIKDIKGAWEKS